MSDDTVTNERDSEISGGEALVRTLESAGVPLMFGMGGFQLLPMYRALADSPRLRHVLIHDERSGAFMADGFARVSGCMAASDGTLGPGATNLITGLAESFGASIPQLAITGDVNRAIAGRGATQESLQVEMIRPTVKQSITINDVARVPELTRRAILCAVSGRPGPVHLNIPEHIAHGRHSFGAANFTADGPISAAMFPPHRIRPETRALEAAAQLISRAQRPLILAGGGVHISRAYTSLARVAFGAGIPVVTSISGKGAIAETDELALGIVGRYSLGGNEVLAQADVLLVVGCKLGEIVTNRFTAIPTACAIIQIDIDPARLGVNYRTAVAMCADADAALTDLADALGLEPECEPGQRDGTTGRVRTHREALHGLVRKQRARRAAADAERTKGPEDPVDQGVLMLDLSERLPPDTILVADGGFAAHWSALYYRTKRAGRHYIANRGHASIGYGVPGAIGAALARPDAPVVALCGDAGFGMTLAELETALRLGTRIIAVVVNNQASGYVKALQYQAYGGHYQSVDYLDLRFADVAIAMGARGVRVRRRSEFGHALTTALEGDGPFVIDVTVTRDPALMLPAIDSRTSKGP